MGCQLIGGGLRDDQVPRPAHGTQSQTPRAGTLSPPALNPTSLVPPRTWRAWTW